MSTEVVLAIALVLYLLSCVRAWRRITKSERGSVEGLVGLNQVTHPPHPLQRKEPIVLS